MTEPEPEPLAEAAPEPEPKEEHDRFGRVVAVVTIAATLLAALVGYAQTTASGNGGDAASESRRLAVENFAGSSREADAAQVQYDRFRLAQEQRRRAANALQQRVFGDRPDAEALRLEERRWTLAAQRTERGSAAVAEPGVPPLTRLGPDGPERDATFPSRYFKRVEAATARRAALRDARDAESAAWGAKATAYTVMLTMLAVGIYLFGFSLSPTSRPMRGFLAGVAGLVVTAAALWALGTALNAPKRAPDRAARAYAAGSFAFESGDARTAVRRLTEAIRLRPNFAKAYLLRAHAEFEAASPQRLANARSLAPLPALRREMADLERARALGSQDPGLFLSLGFAKFQVGVVSGDSALVATSLRTSRAAAAAAPRDPVPIGNVAVALLAQGRMREALATYRRGSVIAAHTGNAGSYTAGALTDLEIVAGSRLGRARARDIAEAKRDLVERAEDGKPVPSHRVVRRPRLRALVFTGSVEAGLVGGDVLAKENDTLALQWYQRDPGGLGWYLLPEVSGYAEPECSASSPAEYGNCFDGSASDQFVRSFYVGNTTPATCLPPSQYRVEAYANGRLVGVAHTTARHEALDAFADNDVGLAACVPRGWRPYRRPLPGLLNGRVSPDGRRGLFAMTISDRIRPRGGADEFARTRALLDEVIRRFAYVFPGRPRPVKDFPREPFMALDGEFVREYAYPGGTVFAGGGIDNTGAARIGMVFGPERTNLSETFYSFSLTG